jgi:CHASE2 domain-containing sensor protein/signal transduction histidine kinase
MNLRLRLTIEWLLIGIAGTFLVFAAHRWDGAASFDNLFYDQLTSAFRPPADKDILLVNIDDASLATLGRWPWPRSTHAVLLNKLQAAGPRTIALDILLSESGDSANDSLLTKAMSGPAPVYIPLHFSTPGNEGRAYDVIPPAATFAQTARGIGQVDVVSDSDGTVRRARLCSDPNTDGNRWPHLMELAFRGSDQKISAAYNRTQCEETVLIPYSKRGSYSEISYIDIINGDVPANLIKNRDVIIGATALGMQDNFPVPYADGGILSGSEIMANILAAIKRDNFVAQVPIAVIILLSLIPMWLLLFGFLRLSPRLSLIISVTFVTLILVTSAVALRFGLWLPPGAALLGILLVYPLWGWRRLQSISDFMASELKDLSAEDETLPIKLGSKSASDLVGRQSVALAGAIDHLRDLRRFIANAMADLPDPMLVTDEHGKVTLVNDLVTERLDQKIVGFRLSDVLDQVAIPEHRAMVAEYISKRHFRVPAVLPNTPALLEFVRFHTVEGDTYVMRQSAIESANGNLLGYVYYLADITALARAEEEREQVLQLLSHDMRAPQSAIIASLSGELDSTARKRIESNARRTMQLAQDFVDIARMGETEFVGEDLLLADLLRDVADNFWPLASERQLSITINDQSDAAFVLAEADSLTRAFSNLVDNAIKFSPDGAAIFIDVERKFEGEIPFISVKITDSGTGIAADILPRLFQRFAATAKQSGRAKGTGLGLTYVLAVIERHNGTITAANLDGGGSCFMVVLPEAAEEQA